VSLVIRYVPTTLSDGLNTHIAGQVASSHGAGTMVENEIGLSVTKDRKRVDLFLHYSLGGGRRKPLNPSRMATNRQKKISKQRRPLIRNGSVITQPSPMRNRINKSRPRVVYHLFHCCSVSCQLSRREVSIKVWF